MKKLLLLLGVLAVSSFALADVAEVRVGADLTTKGKFKDGSGANLAKGEIKRGFEIAGEWRRQFADSNFEAGAGVAYRYNKLDAEGFDSKKGVHSVPLYLTGQYNFKNSSEFTPYVKANLGYGFESGKASLSEAGTGVDPTTGIPFNYALDASAKLSGGLYYGIGTGVKYNNFLVDLSYNVTNMRIKYNDNATISIPSIGTSTTTTSTEKKRLNHGTLTLGVGYTFDY